ncbi:unnamed protein product, partial [Brenthis ino]
MAPNFSKDAILQGSVDYFCLICETYLISEEEAFVHVSNVTHLKKLSTIQYVDEYMEDGIKKINGKYFCELCNKLLPVLARVRLHIMDLTHIDKKSYHILKRKNNFVIAFEQFVINEQSWHGLNENSCALCNLEYEDEELHKVESCHILNLIQNKVEFDKNKNVYRKVDEVSFQCLTCNSILALHDLTSHFNEGEHKSIYQTCCEAYQKIKHVPAEKSNKSKVVNKNILKTQDKCDKNNSTDLNNEKKQTKELDAGTKDEKLDSSKINKALKSTTENKENVSENNENVSKNINNDVNVLNSQYVYDENCEDNICKMLNTTDYVTKDENGKTWCILCDWIMDSCKIFDHVEGQHHQTILKLHKERAKKLKNINKPHKNVAAKNSTDKDNMLLLNSIDTFQKNGININFESNSATCKKCTIALEYDFEAISKHIAEHNKSIPTKEKRKPAEFPSGTDKLADRQNSLFTSPVHLKRDTEDTILEINGKTDDTIKINDSCEDKNSIHVPKQTDSKKIQIAKLELKKPKKIVLSKVPLIAYIKNLTAIDGSMFKDIIINEKFVINFLSFCFIAHEKHLYKCILCEESMTFNNILDHTQTPRHDKAINETSVILQVDSEFIRELQPGKFHCGFCNIVKSSWDEMLEHLETSSHKEGKNSANWRLMQYEPQLAHNSMQRQIQETLFLEMFNRFF